MVAIFQDWQHLLFLHWETAADDMRKLLPPGLELDLFQGKAYVGLIPFTVKNSRPAFTPPLLVLSDFHEVNVRTYVRHEGTPGVFFFSLDAANRSAVMAARATYRLPYHFARMSMEFDEPNRRIDYRSERRWPGPLPANCSIRYHIPESPANPASPGTIEHFLIERYTLFTYSGGRMYAAIVEHQPYLIQRAEVEALEETLIWAAKIRKFEEAPLTHYSRELAVGINALHRT